MNTTRGTAAGHGADPAVSFVVTTRNRSDELAWVVARLLHTTDCPIVVVDNHSRDGSADRILRLSHDVERVDVLTLGSDLGAVARNIGVATCRTPYVAFCDEDSWWAPDAPALGAQLFDRYPDVGLLAARTLMFPGDGEDPMVARLANSPLGRRPDLPGPPVLGFRSCSAMVRRSAFEAAGGFSEILHFRGEEALLAMDLAALGWELCYCREVTAVRRASSLREATAAQDARLVRNAALTSWLRRPLRHGLRETGALLRASVRDMAHARSAGEALLLLPSVLQHRRRLPSDIEHALQLLERGHPDDTLPTAETDSTGRSLA